MSCSFGRRLEARSLLANESGGSPLMRTTKEDQTGCSPLSFLLRCGTGFLL